MEHGTITAASLFGPMNNVKGAPIPEPELNIPKKAPIPEPELDIPQKAPIPEPELNIPPKQDITNEELFIAKVLYSETSSIATLQEKFLICCVIQNRIKNRAFGNLPNAYEVCKQPRAFSCVNSTKNKNWTQFKPDLNKFTKLACKMAKILMRSNQKLGRGYSENIVYYHDKSISKPSGWDNKYWKAVLVKETEHFKFYKIEKAQPKATKVKRVKRNRK